MAIGAQADESVARSRGVVLLLGGAASSVEEVRARLEQAPEAWGILTQMVPPDDASSPVPSDTRLVVADYGAVPYNSRTVVLDWLRRAAERLQEGAGAKSPRPKGASILVRADDPSDQEEIRKVLRQWTGLFLVASAADLMPKVSEWLAGRLPDRANWFRDSDVSRGQIETILRTLLDLGVPGTGNAVRWQPLVSHACARLDTWRGRSRSEPLLQAHLQAVKDEILWKSRLGVAEEADLTWVTEYALATVLVAFAAQWKKPLGDGNFLTKARTLMDPHPGCPVEVLMRPGVLLALLTVALARLVGTRAAYPGEPLAGVRVGPGPTLDLYGSESDLFAPAAEAEFKLRPYWNELAAHVPNPDTTVRPNEAKAPATTSQPPRPTVSFHFTVATPRPA